jgi:hypothetical protein
MTGILMRPEKLMGIQGQQPDGTAKTRQIKVGCVCAQTRDAKGQLQRDPFSSTYSGTLQPVGERLGYVVTDARGHWLGVLSSVPPRAGCARATSGSAGPTNSGGAGWRW